MENYSPILVPQSEESLTKGLKSFVLTNARFFQDTTTSREYNNLQSGLLTGLVFVMLILSGEVKLGDGGAVEEAFGRARRSETVFRLGTGMPRTNPVNLGSGRVRFAMIGVT